jgi:hypothetical protein
MKLLHSRILTLLLVTSMWRGASCERLKRLRRRPPSAYYCCDRSCPCCSWSEFRAAIYTASAIDDCYTRDTADSENYAVIRCEPYQVAYMSYDYTNGQQYCGTSSSNRAYLSNQQAVACENVIQNKIARIGISCRQGGDIFHMCRSGCTADCPCCTDAYPEYVRALETFTADSCYARDDNASDIAAIIHCDPYLVAYMSYDYTNGQQQQQYCGTSASAREYLTNDQQALACATPILKKIARESLSCGLGGFDACT